MNGHLKTILIGITCVLFGILGHKFTADKIHKMEVVRGFREGGVIETKTITSTRKEYPNTYWIAWDDQDIHRVSNNRLNLPKELWSEIEVGDKVDIVYVPPDKSPYHRDGIFANDGNFGFDRHLLVVEIVIAVVGLIMVFYGSVRLGGRMINFD